MEDNLTVDTSQIKILEDFFNELSAADQKKIFQAGFRRAAKPLVAASKATAPYSTGNLKRSIGAILLSDEIAILIGAKKGGGYKGWHGHLVENGTTQRFRRTKNNASTGRVIGTHFFERAYLQNEDEMIGSIEKGWYEEIDRFIVNVNKKLK